MKSAYKYKKTNTICATTNAPHFVDRNPALLH